MSDIQQRRLDEVLIGRKDWRQEDDPHSGPIWCFGVESEARLVLSIVAGRYVIYSANSDADLELTSIEDVRLWLEILEPDHAGLSEVGKQAGGAVLVLEAEKFLAPPDQST